MATLLLRDRVVDLETGEVPGHGTLRPTERALLAFLARHPDQPFGLHDLHHAVWGYAPTVASRAAYAAIHRVRALIEPDPAAPVHLLASRRDGYRLVGATVRDTLPDLATNVPPHPDTFVGRDDELAALATRAPTVLTVVGPGGVGKTRLVRHAARERTRPGGSWLAELVGATTADEVCARVARALPGRVPPAADAVGSALAALGPALLALDNAEDALDAVAALVPAWAAAAPACALVATSRQALGVPGEQVLELGPLSEDAAVALLLDRIRQRAPHTDVPAPTARALARAADHLPLALEITAANVTAVGAEAALESLRRADPRPARTRGGDPRHSALDTVVADSWARLPAPHQDALARLAALDGPLPLAAIEALGVDDAVTVVGDLADASLLSMVPSAGRAPVWRLLVTVRAHVRRTCPLDPAPVLDALGRWLAATWTAARGADFVPCVTPPPCPLGVPADVLVQLAVHARAHWTDRSALWCALLTGAHDQVATTLTQRLLDEALALPPAPRHVPELLRMGGWAAHQRGDVALTLELWGRGADEALHQGLLGQAARLLFERGDLLASLDRLDEARATADEIRRVTAELPPASRAAGEGGAACIEGTAAIRAGDEALADARTAAAIDAYARAGATLEAAQMLSHRALIAAMRERRALAHQYGDEAVARLERLPPSVRVCQVLGDERSRRANLLRSEARYDEALRGAARAVDLLRQTPALDWLVDAILEEGAVLADAGRTAEAVERFDAVLRYPAYNAALANRQVLLRVDRTLLADGVAAAAALAEALLEGPAPPAVLFLRQRLGRLRLALGDPAGAADVLLRYDPPPGRYAAAYLLPRIEALLRAGDVRRADADLDRVGAEGGPDVRPRVEALAALLAALRGAP
ncbi:MAG: winged helix-turn-helix domain-containing protein, partial [Myxococcota bacterium]